jgi:hypothetical protein
MAASTNSHGHKGVKGAAASKDKKQQLKHTGGKQERKKLTEDEAKALGLKKLPCCGKYGTHKPEDCRSSMTFVLLLLLLTSVLCHIIIIVIIIFVVHRER